MAEISWIKLKTTMFDDEKIRLIQAVPEADAILVIWIRLLVLAGKTNDDGLIYIQRNMPYTEEMLSTLFNKPVNTVRLALRTLESFNMIDLNTDGSIAITNWEKHQNIEGLEQIRLKNAERNREYRRKKKLKELELSENKNVISRVTSHDGVDIDKDKEKELDKEKDIKDVAVSEKQKIWHAVASFQTLWNFPNAFQQQDLEELIKTFSDELVNEAIKIAGTKDVPKNNAISFLNAVLREWEQANVKTVEQVEHYQSSRQIKKQPYGSNYPKRRVERSEVKKPPEGRKLTDADYAKAFEISRRQFESGRLEPDEANN